MATPGAAAWFFALNHRTQCLAAIADIVKRIGGDQVSLLLKFAEPLLSMKVQNLIALRRRAGRLKAFARTDARHWFPTYRDFYGLITLGSCNGGSILQFNSAC
jgi:hypothetical protein